jgi:hypothetical protein
MKDFFRSIVRLIRANEMYRGGYGFFLKKYSDSECCWKKYSDFGGGKKKSDSEFLSYNLMLNSGKKNCALRDKKINILTLVLSEKKILNETINHTLPSPLPIQVKWSVPNVKFRTPSVFRSCIEFKWGDTIVHYANCCTY